MRVAVTLLVALATLATAAASQLRPAQNRKGAGTMLLQKMEQFVQSKGEIGLSPAEKAEVQEIRSILLMDIMPGLFEAASDAQAQIDKLHNDVMECQVQVTTGLSINRDLWHGTVTKKYNTTECYTVEKEVLDHETEVCTTYEKFIKTIRPPELPDHLDPEDNSVAFKYLKAMSDRYCGTEEIIRHEWQECETVRVNKTIIIPICKEVEKEYEEAICGWHAELVETCTEYMGCWEDAIQKYMDYVSSLVNLQEDWEAEMDAVEKLDCLWEAWNYSSDPCVVNMTMVYTCEEIPINYSNVTLITYEIPDPKTCPPPPEDEEQDDPPLPCSDEFMNVNYGFLGLPSSVLLEMKNDCRECPETPPMPSTSLLSYTGPTFRATLPPQPTEAPTKELPPITLAPQPTDAPTKAAPEITLAPQPTDAPTKGGPEITLPPQPTEAPTKRAPEITLPPQPTDAPTKAAPEITLAPQPTDAPTKGGPEITLAPQPTEAPTKAAPEITLAPQPTEAPTKAAPEITLAPQPTEAPTKAAPEVTLAPQPTEAPTKAAPEITLAPQPTDASTKAGPEVTIPAQPTLPAEFIVTTPPAAQTEPAVEAPEPTLPAEFIVTTAAPTPSTTPSPSTIAPTVGEPEIFPLPTTAKPQETEVALSTIAADVTTEAPSVSTTETCTELYEAHLVSYTYDPETDTTSFVYRVSCKYEANDIAHWDLVNEDPVEEEIVTLEKNFDEGASTDAQWTFAEDEGGILAIQAAGQLDCQGPPTFFLQDGSGRSSSDFTLAFKGKPEICMGEFFVKPEGEPLTSSGCPCEIPCMTELHSTTTTTTTTTTRCPAYCRNPECVEGTLGKGGWLLDNGHCTVGCSAPGADGIRQCGLGEAYEAGEDAIFCSQCLLPESSCVLWGDPHIVPFDRPVQTRNGRGASVHMYDYGDFWIVKGETVSIQGRYWSTRGDGQSMTRGLAIGGSFLEGNVFQIFPLDGKVFWNDEEVLTDYPSTFAKPGLIFAEYHNEAEVVRTGGQHNNIRGVDVMLPMGVRLTANRYSSHLDVIITMRPLEGGVDGHCGNFNGDPKDDTTTTVKQRMGAPVTSAEKLFKVKDYVPLRCWKEDTRNRAVPVRRGRNMDDKECAMACVDFLWFAISGNHECWCGNDDYQKYGEIDCGDCSLHRPGNGKNCMYGFFDSVQPPPLTIADCEPDKLESANLLCAQATLAEGIDSDAIEEFMELCLWDVCFGGKQFADEDAWAAHVQAPCATVADVQTICGLEVSGCAQDAEAAASESCDVSKCKAYTDLGWWDGQVRLLKDGQALGSNTLTSILELDHRSGICLGPLGNLELCTAGQCSRTSGGLRAEFFYLSKGIKDVNILDTVDAPAVVRIDEVVNYPSVRDAWEGLTAKDKFAVRWTGTIKITLPGTYTFSTNSDDGSTLEIDGSMVVDNNGLHAMRTKEGSVDLQAGLHHVLAKFFENGGGAGMILEYSGPDTKDVKAVIPRGVLIPAEYTTTTTTTARPGGLLAEFFYVGFAPKKLDDIFNANLPKPAVVRIDEEVAYKGTGGLWAGLSQKDNFAGRWTGSLIIKEGGPYEFSLTSDDGSDFSLDGKVLIDNDGLHGMKTKKATVDLHVGTHPVQLRFFERGGGAGMIFKYSGPDTGDIELTTSLLQEGAANPFEIVVPEPVLFPGTLGGLKAEFFYFSEKPSKTDVITASLKPDLVRVDEMVEYASSKETWTGLEKSDLFGARWSGGIKITTEGMYTFHIGSDDGSVLFVDGELLVDNDGLHGMKKKEASLHLTSGVHPVDLKFFENGGGAGMIFEYSGPDTAGLLEVVPPAALVLPLDAAGLLHHTTTTTTALALPEPLEIGGLLAEFYYLQSRPKKVDALDPPITADLARVEMKIDYASTKDFWPGLTQRDNFGARWTGGILITTPGDYTFFLNSDDGSMLYIAGKEVVNNDGLHGMKEKSGTVTLEAGAVPIEVRFIEAGGGAGVVFKYQGPDSGSSKVVVPPTVLVPPLGFSPPTTTTTTPLALSDSTGGLLAEVFHFSSKPRSVDAMEGLTAVSSHRDARVDYSATRSKWTGIDRSDKFGVRWIGGLLVTTAGDYEFSIKSDDGSVLYVDGEMAVNNDGLHGMREKKATVSLSAGKHTLELKFFENGGGAGMLFYYSGPDSDNKKVIVPESVLLLPASQTEKCTDTYVLVGVDKKCAYQNNDRLFRAEGMTVQSCYEKCKDTADCEHFSISEEGQYAGVCMGCSKATWDDHVNFQAFDMPTCPE